MTSPRRGPAAADGHVRFLVCHSVVEHIDPALGSDHFPGQVLDGA